MCGIAGFFGNYKQSPSKIDIIKTLKIMKNRGKDGQGSFNLNFEKQNLSLLHSRLAIIDPQSRSNQPFKDKNGIIIFNGMIYNYLEIKKKLEGKNIKFTTNSDTEVLLKFLNHYGIEKINMLDGMWSFAYFNFKKKKFFLCRDRFGEKPLFYFKDKSNITFGSYYDYILNLSKKTKFKLNFSKVENFIKHSWKFTYNSERSETFFKKILSLEPGTYITYNIKGNIRKKKYWNPLNTKIKRLLNYKESTNKLRKEYKKVIKQRLISDYPVSCLLSGGIDSSSIVSTSAKYLKKRINCFSVGTTDKNYDEERLINKTAKKYNLHSSFVNPIKSNRKNLDIIKNIVFKSGNMIPTSTWLIFYYLAKEIKKNKFKVLLSGVGGDEFFSGYYVHHLHYLYSIKNRYNFINKYNEWQKFIVPLIRSNSLKDFNMYKKNIKNLNPSFIDRAETYKYFKKKGIYKSNNVKYFNDHHKNELYKDIMFHSLQGQLPYLDIIGMTNNIETRAPILSKKLFELAFSYPGDFLVRKGFGKAIFRDSLKSSVNSQILNNYEKIGFFTNLDNFFNFKDKKLEKFMLSNSLINSIFKVNRFKNLLKKNNKNNQEHHLIFATMNCLFFLKKYKKYL